MEEIIEKYFSDTLDEKEKAEFELQLRADQTLAREVANYIQLKQALRQELLEIRHAEWHQIEPVKKLNMLSVLRVAAVVVAVIGACWFWLHSSTPTLEEHANLYIKENFGQRSIQMGVARDSMQLAVSLFNKGELAESLDISEQLLNSHPENAELLELNGITYLRLHEFDQALNKFKKMESLDLYDNPSVFYQAITLLKRNAPLDSQEAEKLLERVINENLGEKKAAQNWLMNNK